MEGVIEIRPSQPRSGRGQCNFGFRSQKKYKTFTNAVTARGKLGSSAITALKAISIFLVLLLAIPNAMAALQLNALAPSEANICEGTTFLVYANNTGTLANKISLNVTMPDGFAYNPGSTHIAFPVGNHSVQEPVVVFGHYLNWTNSSWVLGNSQSLKIQFNLTAGCGAPSGKRLVVNGKSSTGTATTFNSLSILINSGVLKITKEPNVIEAAKWDTVNWVVKVENLGTGPAFNVKVNDTNNAGLQLLSIDSPGGSMNWSYARIDPGETKIVNTSFRVIGCSNLVNLVNISWGCGGNDCQKTYAKSSVKFIPYEPDLNYAFNPDPIVVPYCNKTFVNLSIKNLGLGNASSIHMIFSEFNAPYTITNVSGAEYFENNHTFYLGTLLAGARIPSGYTKSITFDFGMPHGLCNASGASGVFNVGLYYFNDCGDEWFPPVSQISYSMDANTIPRISVTKSSNSGKDSLYLGESDNYTLTVNYQKGSCSSTLPKNTILDHYPQNFEVVNAAGGALNDTNQTIIWNNQDLNSTTPWSKTIWLKVNNTGNCNCGGIYNNEFSVNATNDCCGCPLTASTSLPIIVKCFNTSVLSSSNKTADPSVQENCRLIDYTNTYVINNSTSLRWADINFTEEGYNGQTFPDGSFTGNASFNLNGCINVSQITLNVGKNLSFLETGCGPLRKGDILKINYTLRQPNFGTFLDWSRLCVKGYSSGCARVGCFQEETSVIVDQADYSINIIGIPSEVSSCKIFNLTLNITKNSPNNDPKWIAHFMDVLYNDTNYRYIGPAKISGIVNQSGPVHSFEPKRTGNNLIWELGQNVSRGGNINFLVEMRCPANKNAIASMNYTDNCGGLVTRTAASSPSLLTFGLIEIIKTPEVVFTLNRNASWKIYVTNSGSGTAYNVTVVDSMESGLNYTSSRIRRCLTCPQISEPSNTSVIDSKPCGPDKVTWKIGNMLPKQQVMIEVNGTLCGCQNRKNYAYATIGCGGKVCQNVSDSSQVELVVTELLVAKHDAGKVDDCGANDPFSIEVRNSAAAYVYNLTIRELLPAGLKLNDTPVVSGAVPTSTDYSNPAILIWRFNQTEGVSPGTRIAIKFNASVTGSCSFSGGNSRVLVNYIEPCGRFGQQVESQIPVVKFGPTITITKAPSPSYANSGDIVRWIITLKNQGGDYVAKNVTLQDILPTNTIWQSAYPPNDSGSGSPSDPLVWKLSDMPVGQTRIILLNATVKSCTGQTTDTARIYWGCCPSTASTTANLITRPSVSASPNIGQLNALDTCGGDFTLTIGNSGATAFVKNITEVLPVGFVYKKNSARITSNNVTHNAIITHYEPNDFTTLNRTLIWNSTNIDRVYTGEVITIRFKVINCNGCCKSATTSMSNLRFYYWDSCGNLLSTAPDTRTVLPKKGDLVVRKEPSVQFLGPVSWTIYIDNSGNEIAKNVSVVDILGDGFFDVSSSNGTVIHNQPVPNWTTIKWTGQMVPMGVGKWSVVVNARSNETCGLTHINNVTIRGTCETGCIYSNDSAIARALSQAAFRLDSLESLLRGQTDLISSFESLLKNSTLDANDSTKFLYSFDDLSMRQQLGLNDFEELVWCNWNDLEEVQKIKFTSSFEDLLRRQAGIISSNDVLLIRGYCKLNNSEKNEFLTRFEDRLHKEQYLLSEFSKWVYSQRSLDSTEKQTWYKFLASYEDLIRRQARLISSFQELLYSSCEGTFMEVHKSTNTSDANAGEPINYTITVNNTGLRTIENITINDSILGVIQGSPGITLLPGSNKTYSKIASHNCGYCNSCICRICDFALACGDVVMDASNRTRICIASNEVCINISQPSPAPVYPG